MPRLNPAQRNQAIGMLRCGQSMRETAMFFKCATSSISRLFEKYQKTNSVEDIKGRGRKRALSRRTERQIVRAQIIEPFQNAAFAARQHGVSAPTVRAILKRAGLRCRRAFRGPILLRSHRIKRLNWARSCRSWTTDDWSKVLFSDECRFSINSDDRRCLVTTQKTSKSLTGFHKKV